jgi:hypothetical protein
MTIYNRALGKLAGLKPVGKSILETALDNPHKVGTGLAIGAGFGLISSNEGRGPISNTLFWGSIGGAAGIASIHGAGPLKEMWSNTRGTLAHLKNVPEVGTPEFKAWVAEAAASNNPGLKSVTQSYMGFTGTPANYIARTPPPTNEQMLGKIQDFLGNQFGLEGPRTAAGMPALPTEVPGWMKSVMGIASDLKLPPNKRIEGVQVTGSALFQAETKNMTWEDIAQNLMDPNVDPELQGKFLAGVESRLGKYSKFWGGGLSATDVGFNPHSAEPDMIKNFKKIVATLEGQGQGKIARWLRILENKQGQHFEIAGIIRKDLGAGLSGLRIVPRDKKLKDLSGEMVRAIELDIPDMNGIVRHGHYGQNVYIPRTIADVQSISTLLKGNVSSKFKIRAQDPVSFVLKNLAASFNLEEGVESVGWLRRSYTRARNWEPDPYRADRAIESKFSYERASKTGKLPIGWELRKRNVIMSLPTSAAGKPLEDILARQGFGTGAAGPMDFMGNLQQNSILTAFERQGRFMTASENQARQATMGDTRYLLGLDPGAIENPLNKPSIVERDIAKMYTLGFNEGASPIEIERAKRVSRVAFASEELRGASSVFEQGFLMGTHPVFESEIQQARKVAFEMNRKNVNRMFAVAGIDRGKFDLLHRTLAQISMIDEGIIATDVSSAVEMVSTRKLEFDLLNQKLLKPGENALSLIGRELGPDDFLGIDLETGQMLGHTMSGKEGGQGRAIIRDIKSGTFFEKDPSGALTGRTKERFYATLEERMSGAEAKVGHVTSKSFMKNLEQDAKDVVAQWFDYNRQRTGRGWQRMYGNQSVLPLLGKLRGSENAVTGFALQSTLPKYQNRMGILFSNLMSRHLPNMHAEGRKKTLRLLKRHGIDVMEFEDNTFEGTLRGTTGKSMKEYEQMFERLFGTEGKSGGLLKSLFVGMYKRPQRFFRHGANSLTKTVAGPKGMSAVGNSFEDIMSREFMGGAFGQAKMWDSLRHNIPGQASITMHELFALKQYGMEGTYNELISRAARFGDEAITRGAYATMAEMGSNLGRLTDDTAKRLGVTIKNLDDMTAMTGIQTKGFINVGKEKWRTRAGAMGIEDNFAVDLTTAHNTMTEATDAVRKALGTTRVFVPGTKSDIWAATFVDAEGRTLDSTKIAKPLERLLESVSLHYKDAAMGIADSPHLGYAKKHFLAYHDALNTLTKTPFSGRGGAIQDRSGLWATGRLTARPYRSIYSDLDPNVASRILGVDPKQYEKLTRRLMKESGARSMEQLVAMGHAKTIGKHTFLLGSNIRYPIQEVSASLIAADPGLTKSGGIGMESTWRAMKNADFDGDSLVARVFKDKGSVSELFESITDPNSPIFKKYSAFQRVSDLYGGVEQDIKRVSETGIAEDLYEGMMSRHKKFGFMAKQDEAFRWGKMWTQNVGRYSNLAGMMGFMTDLPGLSDAERAMRAKVASDLQQMSIDFARAAESGSGKVLDPKLLQKSIGEALEMAMKAPASGKGGANEVIADVFRSLGKEGLHNKFRRQGVVARRAGIRSTIAERRILKDVFENFFSTRDMHGNLVDLDRTQMSARGEFLDSLLKRGLREEELSDAMASHYQDLRIRAQAGEEGLLNIPSRMPKAADLISELNAQRKQLARSARDIWSTGWSKFKGSPSARMAATVLAGAGVIAASIGLVSSPSKFENPEYSASSGGGNAGRAIMRSPDVAMTGADGEAPLPGSRGGHVARRGGPERMPNYSRGVEMQQKRFYYDQSNRVPRTTSYMANSPEEAAFDAQDVGASIRRNSNRGSSTSVNVVNSPNARRYSRQEMKSRVSDDLYR